MIRPLRRNALLPLLVLQLIRRIESVPFQAHANTDAVVDERLAQWWPASNGSDQQQQRWQPVAQHSLSADNGAPWLKAIDGDYYQLHAGGTQSWLGARELCAARGADLVSIRSKEQLAWIQVHYEPIGEPLITRFIQIGLVLIDTPFGQRWQWMDGTSLDTKIVDWVPGEPRDNSKKGGSERCGLLKLGDRAQLDDVDCDEPGVGWLRFRFVCRRSAQQHQEQQEAESAGMWRKLDGILAAFGLSTGNNDQPSNNNKNIDKRLERQSPSNAGDVSTLQVHEILPPMPPEIEASIQRPDVRSRGAQISVVNSRFNGPVYPQPPPIQPPKISPQTTAIFEPDDGNDGPIASEKLVGGPQIHEILPPTPPEITKFLGGRRPSMARSPIDDEKIFAIFSTTFAPTAGLAGNGSENATLPERNFDIVPEPLPKGESGKRATRLTEFVAQLRTLAVRTHGAVAPTSIDEKLVRAVASASDAEMSALKRVVAMNWEKRQEGGEEGGKKANDTTASASSRLPTVPLEQIVQADKTMRRIDSDELVKSSEAVDLESVAKAAEPGAPRIVLPIEEETEQQDGQQPIVGRRTTTGVTRHSTPSTAATSSSTTSTTAAATETIPTTSATVALETTTTTTSQPATTPSAVKSRRARGPRKLEVKKEAVIEEIKAPTTAVASASILSTSVISTTAAIVSTTTEPSTTTSSTSTTTTTTTTTETSTTTTAAPGTTVASLSVTKRLPLELLNQQWRRPQSAEVWAKRAASDKSVAPIRAIPFFASDTVDPIVLHSMDYYSRLDDAQSARVERALLQANDEPMPASAPVPASNFFHRAAENEEHNRRVVFRQNNAAQEMDIVRRALQKAQFLIPTTKTYTQQRRWRAHVALQKDRQHQEVVKKADERKPAVVPKRLRRRPRVAGPRKVAAAAKNRGPRHLN